jgi:carbamoyltransferase
VKLLGISSYYHDSAATLIEDGKVIAAVQEERFTRKKHDPHFPTHAIEYCLRKGQCTVSDLEGIVYFEKPWRKFDRILESYISSAPFGFNHFVQSFPLWIKQKLFLRQELTNEFRNIDKKFDPSSLLFSEHHLSHAASAYYPSPFRKALVVTFDGVGEWSTLSVATAQDDHLEIQKEMFFPQSLGLFYSTITAFCGFKVNSGEYKVMGLAPYGEPKFFDLFMKELVLLKDDGTFELQMQYFDFIKGHKMFHSRLENLLGVRARTPESPLESVHMDIAASLQKVLEHVLLHILSSLKKEYGEDNLCLAGGVALNCVANSKILQSGFFKSVWIQPAAGDAGGSLGAALAAYHLHFKKPKTYRNTDDSGGMYLGPEFSEQEIISACERSQVEYSKLSEQEVVPTVVKHLEKGEAIGWFQGRMEFGPRALGARSIIADPRKTDMQKRLNLKVKFRESFRPFAPIVRIEDMADYFDWEHSSPYMMFVAPVKKELCYDEPLEIKESFGIERLNFARSSLPAITHIDYSARLQTVSKEHNSRLHSLLGQFKEATGCGVLVNTSFNVRGEPIVCTPQNAIDCFLNTDIDVLIMENIILYKSMQKNTVHATPKVFEMD